MVSSALEFAPGTDLSHDAQALIAHCIHVALPEEAVGLLWEAPGEQVMVIPLANHSELPETSYAVRVDELVTAFELATGRDIVTTEPEHLTLWHSHPSGLVGPSRGDMRERSKVALLAHMVVTVGVDGVLTTTMF